MERAVETLLLGGHLHWEVVDDTVRDGRSYWPDPSVPICAEGVPGIAKDTIAYRIVGAFKPEAPSAQGRQNVRAAGGDEHICAGTGQNICADVDDRVDDPSTRNPRHRGPCPIVRNADTNVLRQL